MTLHRGSIALGIAAAGFAAAAASAATPDAPAPNTSTEAEIQFANHGGIKDWHADGHDAILIESRGGHYYRATFMSPCFELPFTQTIGFVTDPRDVLDRYQSIVVGHQECQFQTFTEVAKPAGW